MDVCINHRVSFHPYQVTAFGVWTKHTENTDVLCLLVCVQWDRESCNYPYIKEG